MMTHHAARRAVVPLGFALGTVSPGNTDEVLACALFDLLPGVSRARVSRARVPLARFADAGDGAAALSFSFPRGSRTRELWVALELRCDACVVAAEGTPVRRDETSGAERDGARVASELPSVKKKLVSKNWRDAFFAATGILAAETCALVVLAARTSVWHRDARVSGSPTGRLRVKRKTSDAPGAFPKKTEKRNDARRGDANARARSAATRDDAWAVPPV